METRMRRTLADLLRDIPDHLRNTAVSRSGKGSPETAQAWIRLAIVPCLIAYAFIALTAADQRYIAEHLRGSDAPLPVEHLVLGVLFASMVGAIVILYSTIIRPAPSRLRRILTYLHDYIALGAIIYMSDASMSLFWVPVIWLSIGNGLRFGRRDALVSSALGLTLIGLMWAFTPSWGAHAELLVLVAAFQLLIPFYISLMFAQRAALQAKSHEQALATETQRLSAAAEAEAAQARELGESIERHRSTLLALTRELQDPVVSMRNLLIKGADTQQSVALMHQVDLMLASIETIEDIDVIVDGTVDITPTQVTAGAFAEALTARLRLVANGPVVHLFEDTADAIVQMRLDPRWSANAFFAVFRGIASSGAPGEGFLINWSIDWRDRESGAAFLVATLHPKGQGREVCPLPGDSQLSLDLGRRLTEILGGRFVTTLSDDLLAQVELPVVAAKPAVSRRVPSPPGARPKVIVVDDNKTVLSSFVAQADKLGFHPLPILQPERVPEAVLEHQPRVVFVDRHMPSLSGPELITLIRDRCGETSPEIVLFSAVDDDGALEDARRLNVRFVAKPIRLETLQTILGDPVQLTT